MTEASAQAQDERPEFVLGIGPGGQPRAGLCGAVSAAGGLGVLDLGTGDHVARAALRYAAGWPADRRFGIRVPAGCGLGFADVAAVLGPAVERLAVVVLGGDSAWRVADVPDRWFVLVEVTSLAEARAADDQGADGVIARGHEAGGRVGDTGAFVLLQQLLSAPGLSLPVWLCGGIGPDTAAAAVVGGAAGVVLDTQLALLPEADVPDALVAALSASDGTDTVVVDGHRVLPRRAPATGSLPVGQDAYLATRFLDRFGGVARAVRAVLNAVADAVRPDRVPVLRPGSPLAAALGTALPVAQGPMTRVSDTAGFAAAVADGGGLPFLALALSSGERSRELMAETAARVGDRPWGVGVLGFAPAELRAAQLAAIGELRPPVALIAGGRPDQARALEDVGIATFLHVPSPGLLAQFLDAGARRFVFEGAECGGHVGPRTSFALWQAQLDVLADRADVTGVQVLFAGGVHDARSAAMVAALAGPLADRGAEVGVLMGTGYLFTEEAVAHGAVTETFQRQVVAAETTAVLHTAPGHATRCVPSPFTDTFAETGRRLVESGVPQREVWQELEELNTGRLRIASKGLRRDGADLVDVDADGQLAQGLFMAGQVATLRSAVTTVAELHADVTTRAGEFHRGRATAVRAALGVERPERPTPEPLDVAVVGMACLFPGAGDLATFWANVVGNRDSVTEVPADRWDPAIYHDPGATRGSGDRTPSKWGGFLDPVPFDPLRYGIPPAALAAIEPVQLLALEAAHRALVDAGYDRGGFDRERTGVVFGAEAGSDLATAANLRMALPAYFGEVPAELDDQLPRLTEDSFPGRLANVISGRIANRLDLGGANYTVDAACASSLAAVDVACKELASGSAEVMLAGGADLHNAIDDYLLFSSVGALSPTGACRTFDGSADGIALGEGVACVVLKRLADAEHDGDRVYAVIKGVGSASDGKALGLTAPRAEGQRRTLDRAYRAAGVSPAEVELVEAHGTGTVVGDRTELRTLTEVFTEAGAKPGSTVVGSVKSQIGHTKCAAGLAGLIKTAMALHTGVRPPTLHVTAPNPAWRPDSPFAFRATATPWLRDPADRVAGVSAFGFGGTNFHVVLAGHASAAFTRRGVRRWPAELFTFHGVDDAAAHRQVDRLLRTATANTAAGTPWSLLDLARTTALRAERETAPVRVAVVATDPDSLVGLLRRALAGETDPQAGLYRADARDTGKLAVLFPGQGSQRPGMLAELFVAFPDLARHLGRGALAEAIFPPDAFTPEAATAQRDRLRDTRMAQPALGVTGLAANELLGKLGVEPDMYAGHSYGELVALVAAGSLDPRRLLPLSTVRAETILAAAGEDPGTMAAVTGEYGEVQAALESARLAGRVVVANHNAHRQMVVSGPTVLVAEAVEALRAAGLPAKPIEVACAFHSPVVAGAADAFAEALADVDFAAPRVPVWSNRTARPYVDDAPGIRHELAAQIASPVLFVGQVEAMYADGARVFLEAGPGRVLGNLVRATLGDRPHTVVSLESTRDGGLPGLLHALAQLTVAGVRLHTGWLTSGRGGLDVGTLPTPVAPRWTIDGHLVRTATGEPVAGGLAPARRVALTPAPAAPAAAAVAGGARDQMVAEYIRSSRELMAAQRDVLLGYLGATPAAPALPVVAPAAVVPVTAAPEVDALSTVLSVIAERTGYPVEMVEPGLDLESDLSVDSIKRTEIAGELLARVGGSVDVEELVRARTAVELAALLGSPVVSVSAAVPVVDALGLVLGVIAERTGYPVEMVEPGLDLEADLSVDSIKRTEIAGELLARVGGSVDVEELVRARTAAELAALLGSPAVSVPAAVAVADALGLVLGVIAERTGYPVEMVEPGLDLEADLSVDSIKRTEIAGELLARVGGSADVEELVRARTAAELAALLTPTAEPARSAPAAPPARVAEVLGEAPGRYVMGLVDAAGVPSDDPAALFGASVLIAGGTPDLVEELAGRLSARGALAVPLDGFPELAEWVDRVDGLICLPTDEPVLPAAFAMVRSVLTRRPRWLIGIAHGDPVRSAGLRGFFRTLRREHPDTMSRLVEWDTLPEDAAGAIIGELLTPGTEPVVVAAGNRLAFDMLPTPLGALAATGAGPAGTGDAEAEAIGLTGDSVVLLVGGARGITARVATAFARAARCRVLLAGRTGPPTEAEHPATAAAGDLAGLRAALAGLGLHTGPAAIDRAARDILARREVAATLDRLRALGATADFHPLDVRDPDAVRGLVKQIHAEHGRLDGLVHAAGVIEDRLIADKDPESFHRVYTTKVDGLTALLDGLDDVGATPRFVVSFGSIAAALGNRGQSDYAAANDALDTLSAAWAERTGHRALTVHWGPWAPDAEHGGMVSPELGRSYAERGIKLIAPADGVAALLAELAWGAPSVRSVVYTASGW